MKNTLEQLKSQLPNTTGKERLDLLVEIFILMFQEYVPGVEAYLEEALILAKELDDKERQFLIYTRQGWQYLISFKYELSRSCYKKALEISKVTGNKVEYVNTLKNIGNTFKGSGDPQMELFWYEKSLLEAQNAGLIKQEIWAHNVIIICYAQQMLNDKGVQHGVKAVELAKVLGDDGLLGVSYYNLSIVVGDQRAIEYLEKALELLEKSEKKHPLRSLYGTLALRYKNVGNFEKSIYCTNLSIEIAEMMNVKHHLLVAYSQKVEILIEQATTQSEEYNKELLLDALMTCEKGLEAGDDIDSNIFYHSLCLSVGEINYYLGFYNKALEELNKVWALIDGKTSTDFLVHQNCTKFLWKTHEALGNTKEELHYYKEYVKWDNKAKHSESVKEAKVLEAKYAAKEKAAELKRMQEMEELKARFFSQITHEFRTPLSLILGPAQQVLKTENNNHTLEQLKIIERNANRLLQLVNQLLDVNKLEAGKMQLKKSLGNFPVFVETIAKAFQTIAKQQQVQLDFINHLDELIVSFDTDKTEKILYNLLSNAFKFTDAGGRVLCELTQLTSEDQVKINIQLTVSDTGKGISEENLPYVFDRFYQADNSYTRKAEGTGIGLSLVKELVELMEGNIDVKSTLGRGTSFIIGLPLEKGEMNNIKDETHRKSAMFYDVKTPTIVVDEKSQESLAINAPVLLLIEDNPDMHHYISSILGNEYILLQARDGQAGIDLAIERIPDIVLSDVMMPEKDGYQVCGELKMDVRTSHVPIVLLTAKAALKSRIEGLEQGADAYLTKPFSAEELKLQLKNLLTTQLNLQNKYSELVTNNELPENLNKEEQFLQKVIAIINENMADEGFNVEKLSQQVFISSSQLYRKIQALTNLSTSEFIRNIRLVKGKKLLEAKQGNVSDIAYQIGLTPDYFSKCFIKKYGISPKKILK